MLYTLINNIIKKFWLTLRPKGNYKLKKNFTLKSRAHTKNPTEKKIYFFNTFIIKEKGEK